jgi:diphosphomevalonate decarboxylase
MQTSVKTSPLLKQRAESVVPERMQAMREAIQKKDFENFADITMKVLGYHFVSMYFI